MTDAADIIHEALRDYVGDGDGADTEVLAGYDKHVKVELLYAVAEAVAGGDSSADLDRARRAYGDSRSLPSIMEILDDFIEEVENT